MENLNEIVMQLSTRIATEKEHLIKNAIIHCIGHDGWSIGDLTGRGEFKIQPDKTEIFAFDGQDLIHFMVAETSIDESHIGIFARTAQKYQLLY